MLTTLDYSKRIWATVKELTSTCTKALPRHITHDNTVATSLRKIANIARTTFHE